MIVIDNEESNHTSMFPTSSARMRVMLPLISMDVSMGCVGSDDEQPERMAVITRATRSPVLKRDIIEQSLSKTMNGRRRPWRGNNKYREMSVRRRRKSNVTLCCVVCYTSAEQVVECYVDLVLTVNNNHTVNFFGNNTLK